MHLPILYFFFKSALLRFALKFTNSFHYILPQSLPIFLLFLCDRGRFFDTHNKVIISSYPFLLQKRIFLYDTRDIFDNRNY